MLKIEDISKTFGNKVIASNFSCLFASGLHRLGGRNGVGKSTLLLLIAGMEKADGGGVYLQRQSGEWDEFDIRKSGVYVPDKPDFYSFMTGSEYVEFVRKVKGGRAGDMREVISEFFLSDYVDTKFSDMSLGVKKKFFLAASLSVSSEVVILDEPTVGLDVSSVAVLEEALLRVMKRKVVLFSSHDSDFLAAAASSTVHLKGDGLIEYTDGYALGDATRPG